MKNENSVLRNYDVLGLVIIVLFFTAVILAGFWFN